VCKIFANDSTFHFCPMLNRTSVFQNSAQEEFWDYDFDG